MPYRRKVEEYPSDRRIKRENQGRRRASAAAKARRRRRKRQRLLAGAFLVAGVIVVGGLLGTLLWKVVGRFRDADVLSGNTREERELIRENDTKKPLIKEEFLTVNPYSRPAEPLTEVRNIFIHYTANKDTSAEQNRSYFENLGITGERSASAHFVIGYEGEIIQCLPLDEIAYAVKTRNYDSISIECCFVDENGKFTDATYQSLLQLTAWLLREYKLTPNDVLRHYDVGGKKCPLYFVEHEDSWEQFRQDLTDYIMEE
ncbi:N-acetylmuramoyl-L-alanine amidase [Eisenbergiella massiliensis]|uniref:N-acetylmuramoyl-L-alanine amidase n=2 Tax=Lachnospiraceae TaxID=186803 RepID=A0A3E3IKB8_9FIRM|nr:N-acetylmuramoyl-L-alanine amidase [Eisenbergiella massiliensis]